MLSKFSETKGFALSSAHFTQADTIIPSPGNSGDWDRYAYVLNNPMRYIDPTGHSGIIGPGPDDDIPLIDGERQLPVPPPPPSPSPDPDEGNSEMDDLEDWLKTLPDGAYDFPSETIATYSFRWGYIKYLQSLKLNSNWSVSPLTLYFNQFKWKVLDVTVSTKEDGSSISFPIHKFDLSTDLIDMKNAIKNGFGTGYFSLSLNTSCPVEIGGTNVEETYLQGTFKNTFRIYPNTRQIDADVRHGLATVIIIGMLLRDTQKFWVTQ